MTLDELATDTRAALPISAVVGQDNLIPMDPRTAYRAVEDGTLPGIRVGRKVLILRVPLLRMLTGDVKEVAA